jgi:hypothetical protein
MIGSTFWEKNINGSTFWGNKHNWQQILRENMTDSTSGKNMIGSTFWEKT